MGILKPSLVTCDPNVLDSANILVKGFICYFERARMDNFLMSETETQGPGV